MNKLLLCISITLGSCLVFSQSRHWILGNQMAQFETALPDVDALPTPSGSNVYEGQQARATHNAYHNPVTGQLLFFIIDGVIYDSQGYIIDDLIQNSASGENILGFAETVIVPDPGNCSRYYIFLGSWPYLEQPTYQAKAYFAVLDLSLPRVNFHTGRKGALVQGFIPGQNSIAYNLITSLVPNGQHYNTTFHAPIHIACTPKLADGSHLLVVQMGTMVNYNFRITGTGISYVFDSALSVKYFMPASQIYAPNQNITENFSLLTRSELEIYQKPNGNFTVIGNFYRSENVFNPALNDFVANPFEIIYKYDIDAQTNWPIQGSYQEYRHRVVGNPAATVARTSKVSNCHRIKTTFTSRVYQQLRSPKVFIA